jgi:hypothetical protein
MNKSFLVGDRVAVTDDGSIYNGRIISTGQNVNGVFKYLVAFDYDGGVTPEWWAASRIRHI